MTDGKDRLYGERIPVYVDKDVRVEYWSQIRGSRTGRRKPTPAADWPPPAVGGLSGSAASQIVERDRIRSTISEVPDSSQLPKVSH